jgi:hypothetical protein
MELLYLFAGLVIGILVGGAICENNKSLSFIKTIQNNLKEEVKELGSGESVHFVFTIEKNGCPSEVEQYDNESESWRNN